MSTQHQVTEHVVRNHLRAFVEQRGVDAILEDYDVDARFIGAARVHRGKREIREFFEGFIAALPAGAVERFALTSLHVEGNVAYITWSVDGAIPLGTDTFVVENGKIVAQTFAMYAPPS